MIGGKSFVTLVLCMVGWTQDVPASASVLSQPSMEENCILSFVVPRDKMKSSCNLDGQVRRRINVMEMKVDLYKQQVAELRMQLDKQRQATADKVDNLEKMVRDSAVDSNANILLERRLVLLEKSVEQLQIDATTTHVQRSSHEDKITPVGVLNSLDANPVTLPSLVRSMVQSEVSGLMNNLTKRFESYVREQILLYNQVFDRQDFVISSGRGRTTASASLPTSSKKKPHADEDSISKKTAEANNDILDQIAQIKSKLNDTGDSIAKQVDADSRNLTSPSDDASTESGEENSETAVAGKDADNMTTQIHFNRLHLINGSEIVLTDEVGENNESYSGENPLNPDDGGGGGGGAGVEESDFTASLDNHISSSRISQGPGEPDNSSSLSSSSLSSKPAETNWKENMVRDQNYEHGQVEEQQLRKEINSMLYPPLAKVMSMVEKKTAALEEKMKQQEVRAQTATKDLTSHIRSLDQSIQIITIQLESLSQGFQDSSSTLREIEPLRELVEQLKKDLTSSTPARLSAQEFDEQIKKIKKLERLMGVYQQSLEHYRNETKHEYRESREALENELPAIKTLSRTVESMSETVLTSVNKLNDTFSVKMSDINEQIRVHEENVILMQIDLSSFERKLNSKSTRSDRDIQEMQDVVNQLAAKQRDLQKRCGSLEQQQWTLIDHINATTKDVFDLKMEVKLSVLDEWVSLNFEYDPSRTDCFGEQYVRRSPYRSARLVGVVLCSDRRYKIFLSKSLQSQFLNIGDGSGMGEDHCEFVGANDVNKVKLSPFKSSFGAVQGYSRSHWGQQPSMSFLNTIKPSPHWYECGVRIP